MVTEFPPSLADMTRIQLLGGALLATAPLTLAQVHFEILPDSAAGPIGPWAVTDDARVVLADVAGGKAGWSAVTGSQRITDLVYTRAYPQVDASADLTSFAWVSRSTPADPYRAYRQSASGFPEPLEVPAGTSGDVGVFGMSSNGAFVAGYARVGATTVPVVWDASGTASVPYPTGRARAVSDDGQIVVVETTVAGQSDSFYLSPATGATSILATLPAGAALPRITDMSADGHWVVGSYSGAQGERSFRWSPATGPEFIDLPGRAVLIEAVSDDGSTAVGTSEATFTQARAVFWTPSTGTQDLRSFLVANGYPAAPALYRMPAVSANGRTFTGNGDAGPFVVSLGPAPRPEVGLSYCGPANPHSGGFSAAARLIGSSIVWANDLTVEAYDLPPQRFGFFITSEDAGFVANPGGSAGNLCLGGAIGRYIQPGEIQQSGASGVFSLDLDLPATPGLGGIIAPMIAGQTRHFQAWFRDVTPTGYSNFSSGVMLTLR